MVETVAEIVAKKLYFREEKGNARDIFDIALAVYHNPAVIYDILEKGRINKTNLQTLHNALAEVVDDVARMDLYRYEIQAMSPHPQYQKFADYAPDYLLQVMETLLYFDGEQLDSNELKLMSRTCLASAAGELNQTEH